jgi:hypothetical protein
MENRLFFMSNKTVRTQWKIVLATGLLAVGIACGDKPTEPSKTCTSFTYGDWSPAVCTSGTQTRTYSGSPTGCNTTPPTSEYSRPCSTGQSVTITAEVRNSDGENRGTAVFENVSTGSYITVDVSSLASKGVSTSVFTPGYLVAREVDKPCPQAHGRRKNYRSF